jgi:transcription elongation factor Elf1
MNTNTCPICDLKIDQTDVEINNGYNVYNCKNCGKFEMTPNASSFMDNEYKKNKHLLAGYLFNRSDKDDKATIDSSTIKKFIDAAGTQLSPFEKIDKLLIYIYRNSEFLNKGVLIHHEDYPLCYAYSKEEFDYIIKKAKELNYIESTRAYQFYLSLDGWKKLNQIYNTNIDSNQAFVAMWFDKSIENIYPNALAPALSETGYNPVKINDIHHNDDITFRILAEIRKSSLVVADFTGNRGGVYFEAGFASLYVSIVEASKNTEDFNYEVQFGI